MGLDIDYNLTENAVAAAAMSKFDDNMREAEEHARGVDRAKTLAEKNQRLEWTLGWSSESSSGGHQTSSSSGHSKMEASMHSISNVEDPRNGGIRKYAQTGFGERETKEGDLIDGATDPATEKENLFDMLHTHDSKRGHDPHGKKNGANADTGEFEGFGFAGHASGHHLDGAHKHDLLDKKRAALTGMTK